MQNKDQIRTTLNAKRAAVALEDREQSAQQAAVILSNNPLFTKSQHIACYFARNAEFDCTPIIKLIWKNNKNCYLPIVLDESLEFVAYTQENNLKQNRYRILEPECTDTFPAEQLDLVLLPLVGFDLQGNRLGMGKGYYDRTFSFIKNTTGKKPLLIGLAYALQQVEQLPFDEWDMPLSGILTEKEMITFHK